MAVLSMASQAESWIRRPGESYCVPGGCQCRAGPRRVPPRPRKPLIARRGRFPRRLPPLNLQWQLFPRRCSLPRVKCCATVVGLLTGCPGCLERVDWQPQRSTHAYCTRFVSPTRESLHFFCPDDPAPELTRKLWPPSPKLPFRLPNS